MKRMWNRRVMPVKKGWFASLLSPSSAPMRTASVAIGAPKEMAQVVETVMRSFKASALSGAIREAIAEMVTAESTYLAKAVDRTENESALGARIRAHGSAQSAHDMGAIVMQWSVDLTKLMHTIDRATLDHDQKAGLRVSVPYIAKVSDPKQLIDEIVTAVLLWSSEGAHLRPGGLVAQRIKANLLKESGLTEEEADKRRHKIVWPRDAKSNGAELATKYLGGTPLLAILMTEVHMVVEEKVLYESLQICGRTGSGKSQLIEAFVVQMLARPDPPSIVIIDSQADLLQRIAHLRVFAPGQRLADRLIYIDPRETQRPVGLNPFVVRTDRMKRYGADVREQLENQIVDLLSYLVGGILGSEMTSRQSLSFSMLVRLLLTIPGATIGTLLDVLKDPERFKPYIDKLDTMDREFFADVFMAKGNSKGTREQLTRRIYEI